MKSFGANSPQNNPKVHSIQIIKYSEQNEIYLIPFKSMYNTNVLLYNTYIEQEQILQRLTCNTHHLLCYFGWNPLSKTTQRLFTKNIEQRGSQNSIFVYRSSVFILHVKLLTYILLVTQMYIQSFCEPLIAEDSMRDSRLPLLFNYIYFLRQVLPNDETRYRTKILGDISIYLSIRLEIEELDR